MIDIISPLIKQFLPFAQEKMGFKHPPRLFLRGDEENAQNPLGKTAFYDPANISVTLYTTGRHIKDVMRSLAHELVHHMQHERGDFENCGKLEQGYAQNDEHLREMEREAYEKGNMCFRDWEDGIKNTIYFEHLQKGEQKKMSTKDWKNNEIKSLLSEAWGFKMDLDKLTEKYTGSGVDRGGDDDEEAKEETEGEADSEQEEKGLKTEDSGEEIEELNIGPNAAAINRNRQASQGDTTKPAPKTKMRIGKKGKADAIRTKQAKAAQKADPKGDRFAAFDQEEYMEEVKLKEDSGEEEGDHYEHSEMHDDDHIKAIRHHLDALEHDKDYDEEHIEERSARGRDHESNADRRPGDPRRRPGASGVAETKVRQLIRRALSEVAKAQKTKKG